MVELPLGHVPMDAVPGWVRGGFLSRAGAFIVDYLLIMLVTQSLAALLHGPSNGAVIDSTGIFRECGPANARPAGLSLPPQFTPTGEGICVRKFFWPVARSYVLVRREPGSKSELSISQAITPLNEPVVTLDLAVLQLPLLALMRWLTDGRGRGSPGRRLAGLRLVVRGRSEPGDAARVLARRYAMFAAAAAPLVVINLAALLADRLGHAPSIEFAPVLGSIGLLLPSMLVIAAALAIARRRDAFYDEAAGTSVVRPFDEQHDDPAHLDAALYAAGDKGSVAAAVTGLPMPWATLALGAALVAIFGVEIRLADQPAGMADIARAAIKFGGGVSHELVVQDGQWHRLALASFVHWSQAHLAANLVGLLVAGLLLEPVIGASWIVAIFLMGGLVGAAASILFNDPTLLSAGASGAVLALSTAGAVIGLRHLNSPRGPWLLSFGLSCLVGAFWNANTAPIFHTDAATHVGGLVAGGLMGLLWISLARLPGAAPAWGRSVLGGAAALAALTFVSVPRAGFGDVPLTRLMVPAAELPKSDAEWVARGPELARRFPRDPRSQLARAIAAGGNTAEREAALAAVALAARADPAAASATYQNALIQVARARRAAYDFQAAKLLSTRALAPELPNRPELLELRADAEQALGELDEAQADLEKALEVLPGRAAALVALGGVLSAKGDRVAALARNEAAIGVAPESFGARRQRGWFLLLEERFREAVTALEEAAHLNRKDHYTAIWLHIASLRAGEGGRFDPIPPDLDLGRWPGPVIRYLRNEIDEKALLAAAADTDRIKNQEQVCEANFYIAERSLLRDDRRTAEVHLIAARATCPKTFYEWDGARAALRKLAAR